MNHGITTLDRAVLEVMAGEPTNDAAALAEQVRRATVVSREHTGVGFFTEFEVPEGVPLLGDEFHKNLSHVQSEHPELSYGAGFVVFAVDGKLSCLEAFTYDEQWPDDESKFSISKLPAQALGE